MSLIRSLDFTARSGSGTGWNGSGAGCVLVTTPQEGVLVFEESGTWQPEGGKPLQFSNVFRWTLVGPDRIRLEHLRFGPAHPVHLFDLTQDASGRWCSVAPHLCGPGCYSAHLDYLEHGLRLCWSITGPKKAEVIDYRYSQ
jgi:hypothetical protein